MSLKVVDNLPRFSKSVVSVLDDALKEGARDILIKAKNRAPYRKGGLRGDTSITVPRPLTRRVSFNVEYAGAQEAGKMTVRKRRVVTPDDGATFFTLKPGTYTFKNYTTAGTGAHFLEKSGNDVRDIMNAIFKKHARRARV